MPLIHDKPEDYEKNPWSYLPPRRFRELCNATSRKTTDQSQHYYARPHCHFAISLKFDHVA